MSSATWFRISLRAVAQAFTAAFLYLVVPALWESRDIVGAVIGEPRPFAVAYILDVWATWLVLTIWVLRERRPWGWTAPLLGLVPGVAVGLAVYLLVHHNKETVCPPTTRS